jgi:hypothetical protein
VKVPQSLGIVPAVIKEKRIQLHAAFLDKFGAEGMDYVECRSFVVLIGIAEIVPGVVVQERPIRMSAFAFQVIKEPTA